MSRAGRKRKAGQRTKSGALKRMVARDLGCEGVQRRRSTYAAPAVVANDADGRPQIIRQPDPSQTFDALGRAWSAGLLGYRGDELRDGGRKIAAQYWRVYGFGTPDSLARFQPCDAAGVPDTERDRIIEKALADGLGLVRARGHDVRRAFDQLVVDLHPDHGPAWLDRILAERRVGRSGSEADTNMLRLALIGLREVA